MSYHYMIRKEEALECMILKKYHPIKSVWDLEVIDKVHGHQALPGEMKAVRMLTVEMVS